MSETPPVQFEFRVEDAKLGGVYANLLSVWHTAHEFTLDFAATLPPQEVQQDEGSIVAVVPCQVTARVKVAPTLLFDIIQAINENMTKYEEALGPIRRPGPDEPLYPPDKHPGL